MHCFDLKAHSRSHSNEPKTYRFEKKFVNRDVDCCSGGFFWPKIGVDGAEPRRHAFSYDVST